LLSGFRVAEGIKARGIMALSQPPRLLINPAKRTFRFIELDLN
jgi:hypothetical protein